MICAAARLAAVTLPVENSDAQAFRHFRRVKAFIIHYNEERSMKQIAVILSAALVVLLLMPIGVAAQEMYSVPGGYVLIPASSIEHPQDIGLRAHTNFEVFVPNVQPNFPSPPPFAETPASLACVYELVPQVAGCPINGTTQLPTGGFGAVVIVDAYDNPDAEQDLITYSTQFGLPSCTKANGCFSQVYANGTEPPNDPGGWSMEEALDIEMAHAMAPNAKIILVEAADNSNTNLYAAEDLAGTLIQQAGGGTISNSWSGSEYPGETSEDSHFQVSGVVYFAATGDDGAPAGYPAMSPYVVAAGGTTILRSNNTVSEQGWAGSGGGPSVYESRPAYQDLLQGFVHGARGTPDFSADANPTSGPAIYDADGGYDWTQIGGTSVASPLLAGLVNAAGHHAKSTMQELSGLYPYAKAHYYKVWRDETVGNNGYSCEKGYDYVTGIGSPLTYVGK